MKFSFSTSKPSASPLPPCHPLWSPASSAVSSPPWSWTCLSPLALYPWSTDTLTCLQDWISLWLFSFYFPYHTNFSKVFRTGSFYFHTSHSLLNPPQSSCCPPHRGETVLKKDTNDLTDTHVSILLTLSSCVWHNWSLHPSCSTRFPVCKSAHPPGSPHTTSSLHRFLSLSFRWYPESLSQPICYLWRISSASMVLNARCTLEIPQFVYPSPQASLKSPLHCMQSNSSSPTRNLSLQSISHWREPFLVSHPIREPVSQPPLPPLPNESLGPAK